jgi:outer membrane biosynthesis protein TonB
MSFMRNAMKSNFGKVAVFAINGLLIATGALAINNNQKDKKSLIETGGMIAESMEKVIETPVVSADNIVSDTTSQPTALPGTETVPASNTTKSPVSTTPIAKPTAPATKPASTKTVSTPKAKATSAPTPAPKPVATPAPAPKPVATPAPAKAPAPAPAAKTKTS